MLRSAALPAVVQPGHTCQLTFSLFDRQAVFAIDGVEPFAPLVYAGDDQRVSLPAAPVRFGVAGANVRVEQLRLDRDIYYTSETGTTDYTLPPGRFFVLGDNSPVSLDSRAWDDPTVSGTC
ncbi:MAG: S26 family signal peptidase [Planctomycetaceae bacterium]